jgi:NitT/TauT family transport system substrate-binding protein
MLVAVLGTSAAVSAATPPARIEMRETGFRVLYMAPVLVAINMGFFREEGIDFSFTEIQSGALGPASVLSGNAQVSDTDPVTVARLQAQGQHVMFVYNLVNRVTVELVMRTEVAQRKHISRSSPLPDRYAALKDLTIGITQPGASGDVFARYFLIKAGLKPDRDANIIPVGGIGGMAAAFHTARIDAFLQSPPLPQQLQHEGVGQIIICNTCGDVPELSNAAYVGIFATADYVHAHPEAIRGYDRAVAKATAWIRGHRTAALKFLGQTYFQSTPPDTLAISLDATMPAVSSDGRFTTTGVHNYLNIFSTVGLGVAASPAEGTLWTNKFAQ